MSLFGKLVKTAVNAAIVPVAIAGDVLVAPVTAVKAIDRFMGGERKNPNDKTFTERAIQTLKDEADE